MLEHLAPTLAWATPLGTAAWILLLSLRPHLLGAGLKLLRAEARASAVWLVGLQALFWLGVALGKLVPALQHALERSAQGVLGGIGLEFLARPEQLAGGIFVWNLLMGFLLTGALTNLLAGAGSVLIMPLRAVAVGIALSAQPAGVMAVHAGTILIELSAYALLGLGGWLTLRRVIENTGQATTLTLRDVLRSGAAWLQPTLTLLPLGISLLLLGAWYEAAELHVWLPALGLR